MLQYLNDTKPQLAKIIMVTGGQRSGKSVFAENLALSLSEKPAYLATARIFDDDMLRRVQIHKERRSARWRNIEAPLNVDDLVFSKDEVVLLDCLTLWATNWFFEKKQDIEKAFSALKRQINLLRKVGIILIIVTNEVGLGGISSNALQRKFADLQGMINQYVGSIAEEVYMVVSGIPVKIKSQI